MTKTKYIFSEGIAFSEKNDLKVLRKLAAEGWIVKRYKQMGYELELGSPEDVIFSIDIRKLEHGEEEDYFELFEFAGWEHVCSNYNTHLFKAAPGTKKIYTDVESKTDKLVRMRQSVIPAVLISALFVLISYVFRSLTSGVLQSVFEFIFIVSLMLAFPMFMMLVATTYRISRVKV